MALDKQQIISSLRQIEAYASCLYNESAALRQKLERESAPAPQPGVSAEAVGKMLSKQRKNTLKHMPLVRYIQDKRNPRKK